MRIIAFADIHTHYRQVTETLDRVGPVDLAIIAGDFTNGGTPREVDQALADWMPRVPRLFAVSGNMDSPDIDALLDQRGVSLNAQCHQAGHAAFFGCSAAPIAIGTPYEIPETEIAERLEQGYSNAPAGSTLVCVPHAPPLGAVDQIRSGRHVGSRAVAEFVRRVQPTLVICGHIHEAFGQARMDQSLIVNCGPVAGGHHAVIDLAGTTCQVTLS
jgi:uncharacterized protein